MGFVRSVGRAFDDAIIHPVIKTVENIVEDPRKLAMVALSVMAPGAGTALGTAMGLTGTAATMVGQVAINTAINGGDVKSAIIAAAIPVVGKEIAGAAASSFVDAGMDKALAESAGRIVSGAGLAAVQGQDPVAALLSGGVSAGTAAVTNGIPGFNDLPDAVKRSINAGVATELMGGDGSQAAANAVVNSAIARASAEVASAKANPSTAETPVTKPADVIDNLKSAGLTEDFDPSKIDWASFYNTGLSKEELAKREALMESLTGQDLTIDPKNWESYNKTLTDIFSNKGGLTSQWQKSGSDRIMINDDNTGIGINTETGQTYALDPDAVNAMIKNGQLNTAESGYVAATGGTGNTPGGSGAVSTTPTTTTPDLNIGTFKPLQEIYNPFTPTPTPNKTIGSSQTDTGPIQLMTDVFGTNIASAQKTGARGYGFSAGGDIDELLRLLRS